MGTTENVQAWSKTAATNSTADAGINWAEGQDPATVNNSARGMMAALKKYAEDTGGALVAGGSANALTVTTKQVLSSGHVADGLTLQIEAASDNTSATVTFAPDSLTAANIKRADGSALAVGSIKSGMRLILCYDAGASEWRCANIPPLSVISGGGTSVGLVLLTSGTVAAATLDIVLTGYTAYRGLQFVLGGFLPATDAASLWMRFSTDGGSNYLTATNYSFASWVTVDDGTSGAVCNSAASTITMSAGGGVGNASTEGINAVITMLNQTSTAFYTRVKFATTFMDPTATSRLIDVVGSGCYKVAQDTDAVRFMFSAGNISAGNYAVYGLV